MYGHHVHSRILMCTSWDLEERQFSVGSSCGAAADWAANVSGACVSFESTLTNGAWLQLVLVAANATDALLQPCGPGPNGSFANLTRGGFVLALNVSAWPFASGANRLVLGLFAQGAFDGLDVEVQSYAATGNVQEVRAPAPFMALYVHFWQCALALQPDGTLLSLPLQLGTSVKKVRVHDARLL